MLNKLILWAGLTNTNSTFRLLFMLRVPILGKLQFWGNFAKLLTELHFSVDVFGQNFKQIYFFEN